MSNKPVKLDELSQAALASIHYVYCRAMATGDTLDCNCNKRLHEEAASMKAEIAALQARLAECERQWNDTRARLATAVHQMKFWESEFNTTGKERDEARAQLTETQKLLEVQLAVGDKLQAELAALRETYGRDTQALKDRIQTLDEYFNKGNVWHWESNGENHLESLVCPILISAEDLRDALGR